jgi:regulator of protease activity HflC (stomatin/prohibitin superfamily)
MGFYVGAIVLAIAVLLLITTRHIIVLEYERALRYDGGSFRALLGPGAYWIFPWRTRITKVDVRPAHITVPGQDLIAADGVGLKISVSAKYQVKDPAKAIHSIASYHEALYTRLQLTLRELVAGGTAEDLLAKRSELGVRLLDAAAPKTLEYGLELTEAEVKDVMFPGDLKRAFSQVVRARQEGLAALEKARGESAALRNLANAAALLESRPALLQLRLLQAIGQDSGNTVVLNLAANELLPVAASGKNRSTSSAAREQADEAP